MIIVNKKLLTKKTIFLVERGCLPVHHDIFTVTGTAKSDGENFLRVVYIYIKSQTRKI